MEAPMNPRIPILAGIRTALLAATISCAGTSPGVDNPTTPDTSPDLAQAIETQETGHHLWAYYQVYVNPEENEVKILPFRQVSIHWNILGFLEQWPCTTCVGITLMPDSPQGNKVFDVQIIHPFTVTNFTGFDVRGIAMFAGSHTFPVSGLTTPNRHNGDGELVNADGYTTLYNASTAGSGPDGLQGYIKGTFTPPQTPNAFLNGYKRHISADATNTRNAFFAGDAVTATYEIDMPDSSFIFGYAVDANWAKPTANPVVDPMTEFPPEANCPEPWKIEVTEEPVDQGLTDEGGSTKLIVDVYDWQGMTSYFPPDVECNELFGGSANAVWTENGPDYSRFEVTIENEKIAEQGEYKCLVAVEDTENITSPDWLDLTAYQIIILEVGEFIPQENLPPTAAAHAAEYEVMLGETVYLFDDSTDPDGPDDIIGWEWDVSYNPVDGFIPGFFQQNPEVDYTETGVYKVQLRVTDTADHQDMLATPLSIIIQGSGNDPPMACGVATNIAGTHVNVDKMVNFEDCSEDPDGYSDIVSFKWDLDGNGTFEKPGSDASKIYTEGEDVYVDHWVRDSAGHEDTLDDLILIEVNDNPVAAAEADKYNISMGELVTLTNTSYDDDGNGDIEDIYWDIDGNGDYDDPEDIQNDDVVEIMFYESGTHYIGLKVVDEWDLEDELDPMLEINVEGFDPFCVDLIDQYNSAESLYGTRTFYYFQDHIGGLDGLDYQDPDGPWDFTVVPPSAPAICSWLLPSDPEIPSGAKSLWPNADFFFKEDAPTVGGVMYCPHQFDFVDAVNGDLILEGQWHTGAFDYGDTFYITHPICHPWYDSGAGTGNWLGLDFDITWDMETLGTGPALFVVNGEPTLLNCMLIRHHMSFVESEYASIYFTLLNYQWIDEDGNEVAFMQADTGLTGTNFNGNTYTGTVICRALISIS